MCLLLQQEGQQWLKAFTQELEGAVFLSLGNKKTLDQGRQTVG